MEKEIPASQNLAARWPSLCAVGAVKGRTLAVWAYSEVQRSVKSEAKGGAMGAAAPTHPDKHVVRQVTGVSELASDSSELEERVLHIERLDGGLEVLQRLANPHD
jgi:hypothetical protein